MLRVRQSPRTVHNIIVHTIMTHDLQARARFFRCIVAAALAAFLPACPLAASTPLASPAALFPIDPALTPRAGVFVRVVDGHLAYGGERLRLWGAGGHFPWYPPGAPDAGAGDVNARRLRLMGFNAYRIWGCDDFADAASAPRGEFRDYRKGDGSQFDHYDRFIADLEDNGLFVWVTAPHFNPLGFDDRNRRSLLHDNSFLAPGAGWQEWKSAVGQNGFRADFAKVFDDRLQRLYARQTVDFLNHVNPYTGKRYAVDEHIAIISLDNENSITDYFLAYGDFKRWPPYFRNEAALEWNAWLRAKYRDNDALSAAYGKLDAGESLGSIGLHPLLGERDAYPAARAEDLTNFLADRCSRYYDSLRDTIRALAPAGDGCSVIPILYNTQGSPNLLYQAIEARGDIYSASCYSFTLRSLLADPPNAQMLEASRIAGKPTVLYEVNSSLPNPYRAEFPLRLAALASWQDFDGVFVHYWSNDATLDGGDDQWSNSPLLYPGTEPNRIWDGVVIPTDPALTSSYAAAGQAFLRRLIAPAPNPAVVRVGNDAVYGYGHWRGLDVRDIAYSRGVRIAFTELPGQIAPALPSEPAPEAAVASGSQILWDWPNGRLIVDAPGVKILAGTTPDRCSFRDGITVSGFNCPFAAWALVSRDSRPLVGPGASSSALVLAEADARNTAFKIAAPPYASSLFSMLPAKLGSYIVSDGGAPVVKDRVGFTLSFPNRLDARALQYDFALHAQSTRELANANALVQSPSDAWLGVLDIGRRGAAAAPVIAPRTGAAPAPLAAPPVRNAARLSAGLPNPIPELNWGMSYASAYHAIRADGNSDSSALVFSRISREDESQSASKAFTLFDCNVLLDAPANITIAFENDSMSRIVVTFTQPPDWTGAVEALSLPYGRPLEDTVSRILSAPSAARWRVPGRAGAPALDVDLEQAQAQTVLTFAPAGAEAQ